MHMKDLARAVEVGIEPQAGLENCASVSTLAATADLTLLLDHSGVICDITLGPTDQPIEDSKSWLGLGWIDTVTPDSRTTVTEMMKEAATDGLSRRRQVIHLAESGNDIPVSYTTVRLGGDGHRMLAVGRDLRAISAMQERLVEAQQSLERDHWRMRLIETRYRLLFQVSTEALLIVDAATLKVVEANPAAAQLFDQPAKKLIGRSYPFGFDPAGAAAAIDQLVALRSRGRAEDVVAPFAGTGHLVALSVSLVRQEPSTFIMIRLHPVLEGGIQRWTASTATASALELVESLPDGFVVADAEGRVIAANRAFLDLVELPTLEQARGQSLSQWLGRPGADLGLLLTTLRDHGVVRLFGTSLRGDLGSLSEVEVSSAAVPHATQDRLGLLIRDVGRRLAPGPRGARDLTRAVEQLSGLVGTVSLKNLVRDTTDLVERHFIEAALASTADNRTSAAEVLGVSRQSLYMKLRRYNLVRQPTEGPGGKSPRPAVRRKNRKR